MAEVKKLWCVRDPSDVSEMDDILFELRLPVELGNYIIGTGGQQYRRENHKFYDDAGSAKRDAEARMKARGKGDRKKKASSDDVLLTIRVAARFIRAQEEPPMASIHWGGDGC